MGKHTELPFDWCIQEEDLPPDTLDRSKHAKFLTSFLVDKGTKGNYVLNLDAQWGAGKTWFIRRWMNEIKDSFPTVYIDAWKNDHSGDPFLTVVSEIKSALISKSELSIFENNVFKGTWRLMKSVAPEVTKFVIKNKLGIDADNLDLDTEADLGSKLVDELLKAHEQANSSAEDFKKAIGEWLGAVIESSEGKLSYPFFIFIDELDRCRPTYAIEMLETIKHLFDINKVVFVIATDKEQLSHSIFSVYGANFDSRRYLDRFFMRSVTLKKNSLAIFLETKLKNSTTFENTLKNKEIIIHDTQTNQYNILLEILTIVADGFSMDLRTANLWFERVESIYSNSKSTIEILSICFLLALYTQQNRYFREMMSGVNIFSPSSQASIHNVFKSNVNIETKVSVDDLDVTETLLQEYNYSINNHTFTEKIPVLHLIQIILNISEQRNIDNISSIKSRLIQSIYNKKGLYASMEKSNHLVNGNNLSINQAIDYHLSNFFKNNPIKLHEYKNLCELATLLE